ncbi:unnamed protein product [Prorocentrum cordatum]|uniref:Uncharacterized protein n=1 Tax=Prorocentrum cordatum TaxID=2364126 RepID=A0ABN9VWI8_9DINO|nr:unnamed protein product [Polarella glacialis]
MAWLTSVLQSASSVTSSVVAGTSGGLAAGGRCDCHCEWSAAPDQGLLQLLQRQLDRCGPEHLLGQVCPALPPPPVATLALVGVGLLFTGVLSGACLVIGSRHAGWLQRGSRVLVRYEGYPLWHERLLVARLAPSRWVVATPSGDIYDEDFMESDGVQRLGPLGGLGAGIANVEVFRFVNLTAQEKRELLEGGEDYVRDNEGDLDIDAESRQVLVAQHALPPRGGAGPGAAPAPGEAGVPAAALPGAAAGVALVAAESRHGFTLGDAVDISPGQLLASGDRGVFTVPSAGPLCVAVAGSLSPGAGEGDLRTLPVRFDRSNRRFREYGDAVVCLSETAQAGWSVAGPRTCKWFLQAIRDAGWAPTRRHFWWRNLLQVSPSDVGVEEHAYISKVLERACVFDLLDCSELETFEVLSRRYQLWEELCAPALRAAEAGEGAALVCPALEEHVAGKLAQESAILEVVGSGMAFGPQPLDDRPRDLLPFPGGRALDELLLGATGGGLSEAGKRKARRRQGEEVWFRAGLGALSELRGGGGASSDAQVTAAQASAVRSLAKLHGGRGPPPADVDPLGAWKVLQGSGGGCIDSGVANLPAWQAQAALHELGPAAALGPVLRLRGFMYGRFLAELPGKGILEKAAVVRETAGAFFVKRKDGLLRLIFDTTSGESLADLESEPGSRLWVASAEIEVCFYQCELPSSLRPLFAPPPILARYLPARWRKRLELAEGDVECAFQARVVPMGWARAVHFFQWAHEHLLASCVPSAPWLRGEVSVAPACEGPPKLCYVDNLAVVSDDECETVNGVAHVLTTLDGVGVKAHLGMPDPGSGSLELLGFECVALECVFRAGATPSGLELERLIGHLVSMVMLRRDLLSAFSAVYQFSRKLRRRRAPLWPGVRRELRWAHALLPAIVTRSDLHWLPVVTSYDASEWGLGAAESLWGRADVGRVGRLRERARLRGLLAAAGGSRREHALDDEEELLLRLPDAAALLLGGHARFREVPRELLLGEGFGCRARGPRPRAAVEARRFAAALAGWAPAEAPPRAAHRQRSRSPEARLQRALNSEGAAGLDRAEGDGLGARSRLSPRPGRPTRGLGAQRPPRSPPAPSPGLAAEVDIERLAPRLSRQAQNSVRLPAQEQPTQALMELAGWLAVMPLPEWTAIAWGEHLSDFLSVLFNRGGGPHVGELIVSAQLWALPPLGLTMRSAFPLTHQAAAGWARLRPPQSRPPIPWPVAAGIAEWLFASSSKPLMGLLTVLLFVAYCQPGEGLALLGKQVIRPIARIPGVLSQVTTLLHPEDFGAPSKTGLVDSSVALDLPEHQCVGRALLELKDRRSPLQRLFPISYGELSAEMKRAAVAVGCEVLRPTRQGALAKRLRSELRAALRKARPREGKVFLEVFADAGHLSQALRRRGAAVRSIDVRRGPRRDLRVQEVFNVVEGCGFSRAGRAPAGLRMPAALRSPQQPRGLAGLPPRGAAKLAEGNALADRAGQLARLTLGRKIPGGEGGLPSPTSGRQVLGSWYLQFFPASLAPSS